MISTAQWSSPGEVFTTDTCLTGCGGLCGDQYFHAAFPSFVVQQTLDINCLEMLTIIVALKLWGLQWSGLRLTVRCDDKVAVTVLNTATVSELFPKLMFARTLLPCRYSRIQNSCCSRSWCLKLLCRHSFALGLEQPCGKN